MVILSMMMMMMMMMMTNTYSQLRVFTTEIFKLKCYSVGCKVRITG